MVTIALEQPLLALERSFKITVRETLQNIRYALTVLFIQQIQIVLSLGKIPAFD